MGGARGGRRARWPCERRGRGATWERRMRQTTPVASPLDTPLISAGAVLNEMKIAQAGSECVPFDSTEIATTKSC